MNVEKWIASNEALGIVLAVILTIAWYRNRSVAKEFTFDRDRGWQTLIRLTLVTVASTIAWISVFDNWRQLTAIPFQKTRQWESQKTQLNPPSHSVRIVTCILLGILLVLTG